MGAPPISGQDRLKNSVIRMSGEAFQQSQICDIINERRPFAARTIMSIATSPLLDDPYPASDGTPMAESTVHVRLMARLLAMLEFQFRHKDDVFVAANIFLYYQEGDAKKRRSPGVMVVKGVEKKTDRRSFKTWLEGAVPCSIIQLTSKETADEDLEAKKSLYQQLGVREYSLFDPLNEYLPKRLIAYRLVGDEYEEMHYEDDGSVISAELGLRLCPERENPALYHRKSGERLLFLEEYQESLDEAQRRLEETDQELEQQRQMLDEARRHRLELEAELARLKASQAGPA